MSLYPNSHDSEAVHTFIADYEITKHLGDISEILFFLLGAMTIVEVIDQHQGFNIITDKISRDVFIFCSNLLLCDLQ
jgi:Na+/H+ antiporter NhaD/arsenite permease-like protein